MNLTNLKKTAIRIAVLATVFVATLFVASRILNRDRENITMEIEKATFPLIRMERGDLIYNELHGYVKEQIPAESSDNITVLGSSRDTGFVVDTYGNEISGISYELRSLDGARLIESGEIADLRQIGLSIEGSIFLKDLIEDEETYSLRIKLTLADERELYFYTNVIKDTGYDVDDKLGFVSDFHNLLFNKESGIEIKKYLETNYSLNDNSDFANVDIHSNTDQMTYGELDVKPYGDPRYSLKEISPSMAEVTVDYYVFSGDEENKVFYRLKEYYRIREGKERMLLIDYQRSMSQIPNEKELCINDKIVLGITDRDVDYSESEDGNTVAFITAGRLYSYQFATNKLTRVFSFTGEDDFDPRSGYDAGGIKILDVDENGNTRFAVYGYMNSGRHEGEVGIELYHFDGKLNTIEELVYIPYDRSYGLLNAELSTLFYLNREDHLFITLENKVYRIDLKRRTAEIRNELGNDDTLVTSIDHRVLISRSAYEDSALARSITLTNLKSEKEKEIFAGEGDAIRSLGFIGRDVIYGVAHIADTRRESSGRLFFPMYKIVICDEEGNLIKEYSQPGYYVTGMELTDNQLTLKRVTIDEDGRSAEAKPDYITAGDLGGTTSVTDATTIVDVYKTYVQLQLPGNINADSLKLVYPKEIVFEGGRNLTIEPSRVKRYYVYDAYGLAGVYNMVSNAIFLASEKAGWVVNDDGMLLWKRTSRPAKNQIMSITEQLAEGDLSPLGVCLDSMLKKEGVIRNSDYLLSEGQSVMDILRENLEGYEILDLKDCEIDMMLYYVSREIPILVMTEGQGAYLIVGYNDSESAVVILDPASGEIRKMAYEDAADLFDAYGNNYVSYIK